jgi:hypothetical protein
MKLASGSSATAREGRTDRLRRERAESQTLRAAFPSVRQLRIELKFSGTRPNTPAAQSHELYPPARAFFSYPCPYADCDGHFDLGDVIKPAHTGDLHVAQGVFECGGSRPRDHASREPCLLQIHYEISAEYEEKATGSSKRG